MKEDKIPSRRGLLDDEKPTVGVMKPAPVEYKVVQNEKPKTTAVSPVFSKVISSASGYLLVESKSGHRIESSSGTIAWRNNNPGNLKNTAFSKKNGSIGEDYLGHAVFPTLEIGKKAQKALLFGADSVYGNLTLDAAIRRYAPKSDKNDPKEYVNYVVRTAKVNKNTIMHKFTDAQKEAILKAMTNMEGFKSGIRKNV